MIMNAVLLSFPLSRNRTGRESYPGVNFSWISISQTFGDALGPNDPLPTVNEVILSFHFPLC
jgi:hypothetical protein